jgi:hypothetical protein
MATAQTALAFDDLPPPRALPLARGGRAARLALAPVAVGAALPCPPDPAFALGWDYARHGLVPPAEHLLPGLALHQGWQAGRAAFGGRTLRAGDRVERWLALRLAAWAQGQVFEAVEVTPNYLAQLDSRRCPVTRQPLGGDAAAGEVPAEIERLNHRAGYAAGNLVALSPLARQAKGAKRWDEVRLAVVLAQARQAEGGGPLEGLSSHAWARLATLMSFATPLPHAVAATLPLRVLPPNRVRLINPIQGLQALITLQLTHSGFAARIAQLVGLLPGLDLRRDFHLFFHSLLPRVWQGGRPGSAEVLRERLEDAWEHPDVLRRWQRFATGLNAEQTDALLQQLVAKGLARGLPGAQVTPTGGRAVHAQWHTPPRATEGWALETAGAAAQA